MDFDINDSYIQYLLENEDELDEVLLQIANLEKYNKLRYFKPYEYQKRFIRAGTSYKQRLMRSGNQTGKTFGAAFEFAYHITGLYPDDWEGERVEGKGHTFWCVGIDLDQTARVIQKALFGTPDIRLEAEIGSGSIPLDHIDIPSFIKDGARLTSCRIKSVNGGYNTLQFFGAAQGQERMMGSTVKGVWIDEEPKHNSMAIYSQCLTRTITTDGFIMMTATPEQGFTPLQRMFAEDKKGQLYVDSASWDECPHIKQEDIDKLLAGVPEFQHDMRRRGLPVLGSGAVFPFEDSAIMCEDLTPQPHWNILASLDFSNVNDASVVCYNAYDPDNDMYYVYHVDYITNIANKNPEHMASLILNSDTPTIPTISPHDGGINSVSPTAKAKVMRNLGVNIQSRCFFNPPSLFIGFQKNAGSIDREPGLNEMRRLFGAGKLKIARSVGSFFSEKSQFFYSDKDGGGMKTVGKDDCIDAIRYGIISLRGNRGDPHCQCIGTPVDYNNGFVNSQDNMVDWTRD